MMSNRLIYKPKKWGKTSIVHAHNNVSVHHAFAESSQSSIHKHEHYNNVIVSIDARIKVLFFDDGADSESTSYIMIEPGGKIIIARGRIHQFVVVEPGSIIEVYYINAVEHHDFDIVRFDV